MAFPPRSAEHLHRPMPLTLSRFRPLQVFVRRPPAFVARFEAAGIRKPSQELTHALQQNNILFDDLVGGGEQRRRKSEAN